LDGKPIRETGLKVLANRKIELDAQARAVQESAVTIILNKPVGYVSGSPEPGKTPAVNLIRAETQAASPGEPRFHPRMLRKLAPAGRLDIDSRGLIVFTSDGRVARALVAADSRIEKEYLVRVEGPLTEHDLQRLRHGLELDGRPLKPAKVEWINRDQLRFVLIEGHKRQIRKMAEIVRLKVVGLKRVRIGRVVLGGLPEGRWRFLRPGESF